MSRPSPFARFTVVAAVVAAVAISDAWLYLNYGARATYTLRIYRLSGHYPIIPAAMGIVATWWSLRSKLADDWKILIAVVFLLVGHALWPIAVVFP